MQCRPAQSRLVRSTVGIAALLSHAETLLCDAVRLTPLALPPQRRPQRLPNLHRRLVADRLKSNTTVSTAACQFCAYLLRIAYGLGQVDEWLWQLRRAVVDACETYRRAAECREVSHPRTHQARGQSPQAATDTTSRAFRCSAKKLSEDIEARARAMNGPHARNASKALSLAGRPCLWELAEDLATEHLQARVPRR
jgi:hypothetical protein